MKEIKPLDIVIIGGGIAGMTAAIYAARANRRCAILESNITGGLANSTYIVENFPSHIDVHGMELMQRVRDQVDRLSVAVEEICEIQKLDLDTQPKYIETAEEIYETKAVILATGRKPVPLETRTECEQVHYCSICDGASYKGKKVLVVGGGNSGFDEGLYLKQLGVANLVIVEVMDRFFAAQSAQDALLGSDNVDFRLNTAITDLEVENGLLKAAILKNTVTKECSRIKADGIFVFLGQTPNSEMFKDSITLDPSGYIMADESMRTNLSGVFSAGDINVKQFRQLTTAAADGTIAALMADRHIRSLQSI